MSPIPKPPKAPNPVQKAIAALIEQTKRDGTASIDGVIVHPRDLPALQALMEDDDATRTAVRSTLFGAPVFAPPKADGPLTKAWREHAEQMKNAPLMPLGPGAQITGVSWDEIHQSSKSDLERQLEDSLWALSEVIIPAGRTEVEDHSPHMQGSTSRIKKVRNEFIDILCPCKTVLRFNRCPYLQGANGSRCEEEVPRVEAGTVFCVFHRPGQPWKPGSRFFKCSYWENDGTECTNVAVMTQHDGRHMCANPDHRA